MEWTILTVFFAQHLGLSTVSGSCYYNSNTSSYDCYSYDYHYTIHYYYYTYSYGLRTVAILGVIYGSLAGLASLVGLTICLCIKCRKTTSNQGAFLYQRIANDETGVQTPIQSYNQDRVYSPYPVHQQTDGELEMFSTAPPPQRNLPPTKNQDSPPN
ncbi:uncharacterized protein LOC134260017 [Saccostrea cucullata]|uniref:uncharacterized protein LOC134260017 n=1 Tax=Saccostrea cuccullata TaxID=36930 RepID=UPI002ED22A7B